jgi:hypothetical protein
MTDYCLTILSPSTVQEIRKGYRSGRQRSELSVSFFISFTIEHNELKGDTAFTEAYMNPSVTIDSRLLNEIRGHFCSYAADAVLKVIA